MNTRTTIFLTSICLAACAPSTPSTPSDGVAPGSSPIIGGTVDKGDPSVVLMKAEEGNSGWWCTGTVVAKRLVLTAAHCVEDAGPSTKIRVMFGYDQSSSKPGDYIAVKQWAHDPKYMADNNIAAGHDAAVLILASDAPVAAIPINHTPLTKAMIGSPVHVVGFGNDNGASGTGAGLKREIHTTMTSLEQGVVNIGHQGQTTCQGDSGGPSFMTINGAVVIVGITSYGEQGCVSYGSSTRVDLSAGWIDPYIQANGGDSPPPPPGPCQPSCNGKVCGDDGCGGLCGSCDAGTSCSSAGQCDKPEPPPPPPPPPPAGGGSESEPNDSPDASNPLGADGVTSGRITEAWDHDWYTFQVGAGATYTLALDTAHEYVMTLYKDVGSDYLYEITSSFDEISKQTPNGGTYYLEIWGGNGDHSPDDDYFVKADLGN